MDHTQSSQVVAFLPILVEQTDDTVVISHWEVDHTLALLQKFQCRTRADLVVVLEVEDGNGDCVSAEELATSFGELGGLVRGTLRL